MLDLGSPDFYTKALTPPDGKKFCSAIGTTFSLDPEFLLLVPLALSGRSDEKADTVEKLKAVQDLSKSVTVYVQRGRMQAPQKKSILYGLFENMIAEVLPEEGVFHPKVWALRFVQDKSVSYRLIILTKNMTKDVSLDLSLMLEGSLGKKEILGNKALKEFFNGLAKEKWGNGKQQERAKEFAEELSRVEWELPEGFDEVKFFLPWKANFRPEIPEDADKVAVVSPFCTKKLLEKFAKAAKNGGERRLVSRQETLAKLGKKTLNVFETCQYLYFSLPEDTEDDAPPFSGLHAKLYLWEKKKTTHVLMGSANATESGWGNNWEILAELKGKTSEVGGIDDLLGTEQNPGDLGRCLVKFTEGEESAEADEYQEAQKILEEARDALVKAELQLKCRRCPGEDEKWKLTLEALEDIPSLPEQIKKASVRSCAADPSEPSGNLLELSPRRNLSLGAFPLQDITALVTFELETAIPKAKSLSFSLDLPIDGLPEEERNAAITRNIINDEEKLLRYLLPSLEHRRASKRGPAQKSSSAHDSRRPNAGESVTLLEEWVRAYCFEPEALERIDARIKKLEKSKKSLSKNLQDILELWKPFESARG